MEGNTARPWQPCRDGAKGTKTPNLVLFSRNLDKIPVYTSFVSFPSFPSLYNMDGSLF